MLLIISRGATLEIGKLGTFEIPSGVLAYAGSAKGPGGLGARIGRHFAKGKTVRWHIDYLTEIMDVPCALALPGEEEISIARILREVGKPLIRGFGCSDRRSDGTHLYLLSEDLREALRVLIGIRWKKAFLVWNPSYRPRSAPGPLG